MLCKRWLGINEAVAYKRMLSWTKNDDKNMGNFFSEFNVNGKGW
jgi:hypothetical protein